MSESVLEAGNAHVEWLRGIQKRRAELDEQAAKGRDASDNWGRLLDEIDALRDYDVALELLPFIAALEAELTATRNQLAAATGALTGLANIYMEVDTSADFKAGLPIENMVIEAPARDRICFKITTDNGEWKEFLVSSGDFYSLLKTTELLAATPPAGAANEEAR